MAGFVRTEVTVLGRMGDVTWWGAVSDTTKALTTPADTDRLTYAKQGDVFSVSATDGVLNLILQGDASLADANA